MQQALALVGESDRALRELMRRALEEAGYSVAESESAAQLEVALRTETAIDAPKALLVVSTAMFQACSGCVVTLTQWRAARGHPAVFVLLTCEFGTLEDSSLPNFGACSSAGILEKPFDLALLQRIASGCRALGQPLALPA